MVCTSYLLHHVFPSPSPWSLLGQWREYVCLYFLHVLFRPQLRLVSFFFCCLNNPCCIYKQNLSFKNHRFFFFPASVTSMHTRHLYIFHNTSCLLLKILLPSNYLSFREWRSWVLTIYMGKPKILVGKWNGSRHSVWTASENMGCDLRRWNFSTVQLILIYFVAGLSPITSSFIVLCLWVLYTRFPPGWFV